MVCTSQASTPASPQPWRARLNNLKMTFLGSPRFHRKKSTSIDNQQPIPMDNGVQMKTVNSNDNSTSVTTASITTTNTSNHTTTVFSGTGPGRITAESSPDSSPL